MNLILKQIPFTITVLRLFEPLDKCSQSIGSDKCVFWSNKGTSTCFLKQSKVARQTGVLKRNKLWFVNVFYWGIQH